MGGAEQREEAIALRDTFGQVAKDISRKAGEFHDVTADAASQGAHALADTDGEFGGKFNDLGNNPDPTPTPRPTEPPTTPGSGGGGGAPSTGPIDDNFQGGGQGGQGSEGNGQTPACKDPIDPVSGQMMTSATDLALPGILPLILRRAYASGYLHGQLFGPGWSSTLDERLIIDDDGIHYLGQDAQTLNYPVPTQPGQQVLPAAGARWPLTWDRKLDAIEIHDPATGTTHHFPPPPRENANDLRQIRHLTRITDRNDNWLTITRDTDAVPTQLDHVGGYRVFVDSSYHTDAFRIDALRLPDPTDPTRAGDLPLVGYGYDPAGRLVQILNALGEPLTYEYDHDDRITAWIDRGGYQYSYQYDDQGRIAHVGGEDGALTAEFAYDTTARCTRVTDADGAVNEYWYDEHNHLTKLVDPLGNTTVVRHDRYGRLTEQNDALGNTTRFVRDASGNVLELHRADGSRTLLAFNAFNKPVRVTAPSGAVSTYEYDERGNLISFTDATGAVRRYAYDEHGATTAATDQLGNTTSITVNRAGLPLSITDPVGATWSATRDASGRVTSVVDPLGYATTTEFDAGGRPTSRTHPDGGRETWEYTAAGNLARHVNQAGFETRFEHGPFRRVRARVEPDGARYEFSYDAELRLTSVANPLGATWTYEYDLAGNLVAEKDFDDRRVGYVRDGAGAVIERVNGAGERVALTRDGLGRVIEQRLPTGAATTFEYNADGELIRATGPDGQVEFVRDAAGRVLAETVSGRTSTASFDAAGRRASLVTPSGRISTWQYDAAGRPEWLTAGTRQIAFGHDAAGRETHRWLSDQTALTREWDPVGRLVASRLVSVVDAGDDRTSTILHERTWTYRADGYPDSSADTVSGLRAFTLDPLGRVTTLDAANWTERYAYDAAGNLTDSADTRTPDRTSLGQRQLTGTLLHRTGRTTHEYDAQGRLIRTIRRTLSGGRRVWCFAYDALDRITSAQTPDGHVWHYTYDPLGRRIGKQRIGPEGEILEETRFTWDGSVLAEEEHSRSADGRVTVTTWDYEPNSWRPVSQDRRSYYASAPQEVIDEQFHAILTDIVGTATELAGLSGEISWRRETSLWGTPLVEVSADSSPAQCPLRFPGQYHDAETGLDYNVHRYYDPDAAAYLTPDPLGLDPAPNPRAYIDNPLVSADPYGLAGERVNPRTVRFSQDSVSKNFKNGSSIEETAQAIRAGTVKVDDFPPIRLVEKDGQLYTLDNRRLVTFQKAGVDDVPYTMATPQEVEHDAFKFSTKTEGQSITVRGTGEEWAPPCS